LIHDENIKLASFAKIMNSTLLGNAFIGMSSCVNRCDLGRYIGLAYFSYLADTNTGNYCTFGSRISIGAFSHPTDNLTVHEMGYRNTLESYGDTVLQEDALTYIDARANKTIIGNDVWIGDNSVVIKGVEISNGAIVAAGSIVTRDVAPYSIVAGNPAKEIRTRFPDKVIERLLLTNWWERSMQELTDVPFEDIHKSLEILEEKESK
jgi:acetyltransferase-like isoleucine patch superfamily enzyme